jgi:hypothetical protein
MIQTASTWRPSDRVKPAAIGIHRIAAAVRQLVGGIPPLAAPILRITRPIPRLAGLILTPADRVLRADALI